MEVIKHGKEQRHWNGSNISPFLIIPNQSQTHFVFVFLTVVYCTWYDTKCANILLTNCCLKQYNGNSVNVNTESYSKSIWNLMIKIQWKLVNTTSSEQLNIRTVERGIIDTTDTKIHDSSLSWHGTDTSV